MHIDFLLDIFKKNMDKDALIWHDGCYSYKYLLKQIEFWQGQIKENNIDCGAVVSIQADFSPNAVALLLALVNHSCIVVPLTSLVKTKIDIFIEIAQVEVSIIIDKNDKIILNKFKNNATNSYYKELRFLNNPGLVLFSSGSTGESKAAVHNLNNILEKFKIPRHSLRAISFLLYDHIGGINTVLYILSNAGCVVTISERTPDVVLSTIEKYQVELLPTSPTFINLIILSEAYKRYNFKSLKTITYGTEPMLQSTLTKFHSLLPHIKLLQTYGLSEVGILRSKSKSSNSLWVKIGGEGFETRIVDNILQIKAKSTMLGYLNAKNPFTEDGWFNTEDEVEVDGEYVKFLGRQSEIINVGGEKVYPAEVESVIQEIKEVAEVTIYAEKNAIVGNIVCAKITLLNEVIAQKKLSFEIKKFVGKRLENYKVPVKIKFINKQQHSERFKKMRNLV